MLPNDAKKLKAQECSGNPEKLIEHCFEAL